jgi:hypothetical protein
VQNRQRAKRAGHFDVIEVARPGPNAMGLELADD